LIKKVETNIKRKLYLYEAKRPSFSRIEGNLENNIVKINPEFNFQALLGFGGAFTQSTGYALKAVNEEIRDKILQDYFSKMV